MTSPGLPKQLRLLAVVAHPHDITHMCGTLAHHIERRDAVTAVSMTEGRRAHREKLYDELRKPPEERNMEVVLQSEAAYGEQKAHEMVQACALFGITDVRVLPFPDVPFEGSAEVIETLTEIAYEVRPHLVLTHAPIAKGRHGYVTIMHNDHVETGIVVHKVMNIIGTPNAEAQHIPHIVLAVYYTGTDFPTGEADLFVDITDQAANRVKAEMLYTTQGHTPEWARKRAQDIGIYGWKAGVAYAEPFVRATSEVGRYLTVTDYAFEAAEMSSEEHTAMISQRILETEMD